MALDAYDPTPGIHCNELRREPVIGLKAGQMRPVGKTQGRTSSHSAVQCSAVHNTIPAKASRIRRSGKRSASAIPADTVNMPPTASGSPSDQSTHCALL